MYNVPDCYVEIRLYEENFKNIHVIKKVTIPAAYYTPVTFCRTLNQNIRKRFEVIKKAKVAGSIRLFYNHATDQFKLRVPKRWGICFKDKQLRGILGLELEKDEVDFFYYHDFYTVEEKQLEEEQSKFETGSTSYTTRYRRQLIGRIRRGNKNLFVYFPYLVDIKYKHRFTFVCCNIVEESFIGSEKGRVLGVISNQDYKPNENNTMSFVFSTPKFHSLQVSSITEIKFQLRNEQNEVLHIPAGNTLLVLQFNKKRK